MKQKKQFIELEKVIRDKNPSLLKWMPGVLLRYIKRIVHVDEVNALMEKNAELRGLDFVEALIADFGVEVSLKGAENIPEQQPVIFAANHPLGGLDGIALIYALGKYRQDLRFLVNDLLSEIKNFGELFVPVNKHGSHGRKGSSLIEETYASENAVLVFPAGLVSRKQKGGIRDLDWTKSFINKARKYKKDVIPVYIEGRNSNFFYNLARIRKAVGIKANLEMFYLPDEMFAQKGKKVTIHIGKPISYTYFDRSKKDLYWAEEVKQRVYAMAREKK
ncbi:MAG TPA: 1-acyl-sn-glycerol-3-phosphate acyltransferase [Cyclobacteriaceae bacterium]|nr:1-acyl-sn-glycerol-3-phosphate acyltransferase [Cyclobacteriaceae bacterium]